MIRIKEETKPMIIAKNGKGKKNWLPYTFSATVTLGRYGDKPVTKKPARAVTKSRKIKPRNTPEKGGDRRTGKVKAPSPPPAPVSSAGRPKVHATAADRQRAYRERQKVKA